VLRTLVDGGSFFEGPRWRDGRWWVSDFYDRAVLTVEPDSGRRETVMTVEGQPSGLGWMPDGSLLVVSMRDHRLLRRTPDGTVEEHADLTALCGGPLNDLVVDRAGRAYVGNFGFDLMGDAEPRPTVLARVDPDGAVSVAADDLVFPNGVVLSEDGGTLIVAETFAARLTAFDVGEHGELTGRRTWARPPGRFSPDGCTLDAEGCVWAADAVGGRAVRLAEGGDVVDEVRAPDGLGVFACMLGGDDGRTLLLCAAPDFAEQARRAAREAVLLTTSVEVPHAGLP
jgi:sugar lactone lactonase YvrE